MAKDTITVQGEEIVVREDTAKAFRGTHWALLTIAALVLIAAVLFSMGFFKSATDGTKNQSPAQIETQRQ